MSKAKRNHFLHLTLAEHHFLQNVKFTCVNLYFLHLCKSFWPGLTLRSYMFPSRLVCSHCTGSKGIVPQTERLIEIAIGPWAMVHISISGGKYKFWPGMSIRIPHLWACLFLCIYYICIYIYIIDVYTYIHVHVRAYICRSLPIILDLVWMYDILWCGCTLVKYFATGLLAFSSSRVRTRSGLWQQ